VRNIIRVNPVKTHEEGDVAYIRIPSFNEQTNDDLLGAVENIDLRNNPGVGRGSRRALRFPIVVPLDEHDCSALVEIVGPTRAISPMAKS
jgi:hypothetical protein